MDKPTILDQALNLLQHGFSILPTKGDKSPAVLSWTELQRTPMTAAEAERYFVNGANLAVICGKVSGNLECIDFDNPALYLPFLEMLTEHDPELATSLVKVRTPRGNHLYYQSTETVAGNQKLAVAMIEVKGAGNYPCEWRPGKKYAAKQHGGKWFIDPCAIETRGEGGYSQTSPSTGYETLENSLLNCPVLTPDQMAMIHALANMFDEQPHQAEPAAHAGKDRTSPGSEYNATHSVTDILREHGWVEGRRTTKGIGWTRPGKDKGTSGVLLDRTDNFYVFSTSAGSLEAMRSYDAFGLYTFYEHGGDFKAAARELHRTKAQSAGQEQPGETPGQEKKLFHFVSAHELCYIPRPTIWLLKDYLDAGALIMLFGEAGSLKTFCAIDFGLCIATGHDWHGIEVRQKGPVFYICGEGFAGISKRIKAWSLYHEIDLRDIPFFVSDRPAQFLDPDSAAQVVAAVDELRVLHGEPVLVIVDTLNRNFGPGDEDKTPDMTRFVSVLDDAIRVPYRCAVAIVHHSGLQNKERARGNSALRAALDWEYRIQKNAADGMLFLNCTKTKDHGPPPKICFMPETIALDGWVDPDDGEVMTYCFRRVDWALHWGSTSPY